MSGLLTGVRGRVTFTVLAVTACLYSLLGTLGFLQIAHSGRDAIRDRIGQVLDQLEDELRSGTGTFSITTPDGVDTRVVASPAGRPPGTLTVERQIVVSGAALTLQGTASEARLTDSLRSLFRGLWAAVPLASIISATLAGLATHRALRPVGSITELAREVGSDSDKRVPVPRTGDEIEQLARTVNEMLDRLSAGRLAQQRFTSDAAHELRTPLMALQGEVELAHGDDQIPNDLLDRLTHLSARLGDRVDDLVLLATLDEGRPARHQVVDLHGVLTVEAESISPRIEIIGSESYVAGDGALLARAVRNLLANAVRHSRSSVRAEIAETADTVTLHVDDDGPGVPPEQETQIFHRFGRVDTARATSDGGSGLGLAIVDAVVRSHGGSVALGRSPAGGARFSLLLPRTSPDGGVPVSGDEK